jgi:SAM-dependent methyltransferase
MTASPKMPVTGSPKIPVTGLPKMPVIPPMEKQTSEPPSEGDKDLLWLNLRDLPYFRALLRAVEGSFYEDLDLPAPQLDIGCGDGHFASVTFDQPIDVGIDPWSGPIHKAARHRVYRLLVQGDAAKMPFPDNYFSSALSNSVLEHIPQVEGVLAEAYRVLCPGAPFVFCVPNPAYYNELDIPARLQRLKLNKLARAYTGWFARVTRTVHADPPEVWQMRLETAGFQLERWWHYFSPQALHVLEWGHYFGFPTLLPHLLFRRWILVPTHWNLALTERLIRPYASTEPDPEGTYTFFIARKR